MKYIKQIIIGVTLVVMFSCSSPLTEDQVIENAKEHIENNEENTAKIILQKYLVENRQSERVRMMLAEVLVLMGDYVGGSNQFNKVTSPLTPTAFERKVEALYMLTDMALALEVIKSHETKPTSPYQTSALVYALLSTRLEQDNNPFLEMEKKLASIPNKNLIEKLIDATISFNQTNDTAEYYQKLSSISEQDSTYSINYLFLDLLGNFSFLAADYEKATTTYKHLEKLRPSFFKSKLLIAESLIRAKNWDEGNEYIDLILKMSPTQPLANQLKALVLIKNEDLEAAKVHIERAIAGGYETRQNYLLAADLNFKLNNYEQTINFLETGLRGVNVNTNYHNMLLYAKAAVKGNKSKVNELKDTNLSTMSDIQNVISYFEGLNAVGNQQQANRLLDIISLDPNASPVTQLEYSIFKMQNDVQQNFQTAVQASKDLVSDALNQTGQYTEAQLITAKSIIIGDLIERKQLSEAEEVVKFWLQKESNKEINTMYLADVYNHEKKFEQTKAILDPAKVKFTNAHMYILLSNAYANTQDFDIALNVAKDGLSEFSYNIPLLRQVAAIESELNISESSFIKEVYSDPTSKLADAISLNLYYTMRQQTQDAIAVLENFTKTDEKNVTYWYTLAESYLAANDKQKAKSAISNTLNTHVLSVEQIEMILNILSKVDAIGESIKLLEQQVPNYPTNGRFKLILSDLYLEKGNVKLAQSTLDKVDSNEPDILIKRAQVSMRSGDLTVANDLFTRAFNKFPSQKTLIPYAQHLEVVGQTEQAINVLESYAQKNPSAINAFLLLATMQTGDASIENYNKVIALNPNNLIALNNLALELNKQDKHDEALEIAQKAIALAPDNEEVKNTLELIKTKN